MSRKQLKKSYDRVWKIMENFYTYGEPPLDEAKRLLMSVLDDLIYIYEEDRLPYEEDYRSGADTYGYENDKSIMGNLFYISDRWVAAFRIRWVIDLLKPDYYPYQKEVEKNA